MSFHGLSRSFHRPCVSELRGFGVQQLRVQGVGLCSFEAQEAKPKPAKSMQTSEFYTFAPLFKREFIRIVVVVKRTIINV